MSKRTNKRTLKVITIITTWLAIKRIHVEDNIVYPIHRINRRRIVPVSDRICNLLCSPAVIITSFPHQVMDQEACFKDVQLLKF